MQTKYLAFIDSDAYPAARWIESSFKLLNKKQIGIIAGPHIDPLKQNFFQTIIGLVKRSFLITMLPNHQKKNSKKLNLSNLCQVLIGYYQKNCLIH